MSGYAATTAESTPSSGLGRSLDLALLRAFRGAPGKLAMLRALAALDAERAIEWILITRSETDLLVSHSDCTAVLDELATRAAVTNDENLALAAGKAINAVPTLATSEMIGQLASVVNRRDAVALLGAAARMLVETGSDDAELLTLAADAAIAEHEYLAAEQFVARLSRDARTPARVTAVQRLQRALPEPTLPVRVALLSSYTLDPLRHWLQVESRNAGLAAEIYSAPFNMWEREMRDSQSALYAFSPRIVFLSAAIDDLVPALSAGATAEELVELGEAAIDRVCSAAAAFRANSGATVVVHSFLSAFVEPAAPTSGAQSAWLRTLNSRLIDELNAIENCYVLDLEEILVSAPSGYDDSRLRHLARMRLAHSVMPELARAYLRVIVPALGLARKCLVLDLDNTLWGGVIGEVGVAGLKLANTSPGSEYIELQHYLKALTCKGFLLAIISKNNEADALEALRHHELMVLRETDFVASRINWLPKPENLKSIAEELNLGLDAFVFVDDNANERSQMRRALPQVLTVELPNDPALYRRTLADLPALQLLRVTDEDRRRTELYQARRAREDARVKAESVEEFLASLRLTARVSRTGDQAIQRVQQLFERTNQFNLTTRRYDLPTIEERSQAEHWRVYHAAVTDRFSDHGLVGAAVVRVDAGEWFVENLVLSCRVIGYGAETALLARIGCDAVQHGAQVLRGQFIPSQKNIPAREFYSRHNFTAEREGTADGYWRLDLTKSAVGVPSWLTVLNDAS